MQGLHCVQTLAETSCIHHASCSVECLTEWHACLSQPAICVNHTCCCVWLAWINVRSLRRSCDTGYSNNWEASALQDIRTQKPVWSASAGHALRDCCYLPHAQRGSCLLAAAADGLLHFCQNLQGAFLMLGVSMSPTLDLPAVLDPHLCSSWCPCEQHTIVHSACVQSCRAA